MKVETQNSYRRIKVRGHPKAQARSKVLEHILVAERVLGKYLPESAVVHHINKLRYDNRPENLVICQDENYHRLIHARERAYKACGHADWRKCCFCNVYSPLNELEIKLNATNSPGYRHRECQLEYNKAYNKQYNLKLKEPQNG